MLIKDLFFRLRKFALLDSDLECQLARLDLGQSVISSSEAKTVGESIRHRLGLLANKWRVLQIDRQVAVHFQKCTKPHRRPWTKGVWLPGLADKSGIRQVVPCGSV
ncbi:hypothetical protein [Dubosiella newyorkensis]|uniref:hypothetical protein n=1 Tax=Dubosiella newyorkensis TaxID=1862672 RepID=UPI003F680603